MPTTLALKNLPDELYRRLEASAATNRRSPNDEAILCLESVLLPGRQSVSERLARARRLRTALAPYGFEAAHIDSFKREGRDSYRNPAGSRSS